MKIKRKAYISLEVVFLLTIMVISGMYVTVKLFNKGHNVSGQEAEAFSKVNHTVNNAINIGSSGGGGSGGGGGGSTPSEPTGVIDTIYWGIDASGKLIISDVQVAGAVESGSFAGNKVFTEDENYIPDTPWFEYADRIYSIEVKGNNRKVAPASTAVWFEYLNKVSSINVTDLDTSNVTNMYSMFGDCGTSASTFTITGMEQWDVSKVTDMLYMFGNAGQNAETWNIGDISNWNTSNVTDMSSMFSNAGYMATTWNIGDLSNWNVSNVTDMSYMFSYTGHNATTWTIGDLSGWDTSNVTDMDSMFKNAAGGYDVEFILDLSTWDTSKVTNTAMMFFQTATKAGKVELNFSNWSTDSLGTVSEMFCGLGDSAKSISIVGREKFDSYGTAECSIPA